MLKHRIGRFFLHWILSAETSEWTNIYNIPWCINSFVRSLFNPSPLSFCPFRNLKQAAAVCRRSATVDFPFFNVFVRLLIPFSAESQPWLVFTFFCAVSFHALLVQEPSSLLLCTKRFSSLLTSSTPSVLVLCIQTKLFRPLIRSVIWASTFSRILRSTANYRAFIFGESKIRLICGFKKTPRGR